MVQGEIISKKFGNAQISYRSPTEGERRRLALRAQKYFSGEISEEALDFQSEVIVDRVKAVSDYSVRGKSISSGAELVEYGETDVIGDLFQDILSGGVDEEDLGN